MKVVEDEQADPQSPSEKMPEQKDGSHGVQARVVEEGAPQSETVSQQAQPLSEHSADVDSATQVIVVREGALQSEVVFENKVFESLPARVLKRVLFFPSCLILSMMLYLLNQHLKKIKYLYHQNLAIFP